MQGGNNGAEKSPSCHGNVSQLNSEEKQQQKATLLGRIAMIFQQIYSRSAVNS